MSASKYRKLKQLYLDAVASRDDAQLALFRAQKLVTRLRDDKASLLDRVVELELAAGLTSADVAALRDQSRRSERELAFPLLHPPALPSLADRPRQLPVLTTSTELANDQYNAPLGPAPLPKTLPPRQRSHHLRTTIAAQKLRDESDAQRVAQGLPRPAFPAVSLLGLEGSSVALNVERALAGEALVPAASLMTAAEPAARGNKRRREGSSGAGGAGARGKSRAGAGPAAASGDAPTFNNLPNPFAAVGAVPLGSAMARNNAEALAAAAPSQSPVVAPVAALAGSAEPDMTMDDGASVASGDGLAEDDGGDYKPGARAGRGGARRSDFGVAGGGAGAAGDNKLVKPKKIKQHNLTSGTFSIPPIPRNADGSIRLPTSVGIMQIKSLGSASRSFIKLFVVAVPTDISISQPSTPVTASTPSATSSLSVSRPRGASLISFSPLRHDRSAHGHVNCRRYPSMVDRTGTTEYTCRITDGGDGNPRFELHPSDQPGVVISSGTPTGAWTQVVKATNKLRERNHSNSVSGPDYYGLSHNVVKAMIQELPGADQVPGYIWQHFVEDAAQARPPPGAGKKASSAASKRKSRGGTDGFDMSPPAGGEIAVDDGGMGGYGLDTGYEHGGDEYDGGFSPAGGDYQVQPTSLQHLLASANAAPANPYDIPTSMPAQPLGGGAGGLGGAGAIDPMFHLGGGAGGAFDPYALQGAGQPIIDPAFADASAYSYPVQPGGQPVEYPSSEGESD